MAALGFVTVLGTAPAAQVMRSAEDWCADAGGDRPRSCRVQERTLAASAAVLSVDAGANGGIRVVGSDRADILVRARIAAHARTDAEAQAIASQVRVAEGHEITVDGPRTGNREGWHVSFELHVPRTTNLRLRTNNGGISIANVRSEIDFSAGNGGIRLASIGGDVKGHTGNGGVDIVLDGAYFDGAGLDVSTTNGGVKLALPDDYSAQLEVGTVNGSLDIDFPVTVQGRLTREISATLGSGGAPVRAKTVNGGVSVRRR
jgi:DUF4097 and DUF4098 domain-containing protein YvlB